MKKLEKKLKKEKEKSRALNPFLSIMPQTKAAKRTMRKKPMKNGSKRKRRKQRDIERDKITKRDIDREIYT